MCRVKFASHALYQGTCVWFAGLTINEAAISESDWKDTENHIINESKGQSEYWKIFKTTAFCLRERMAVSGTADTQKDQI